MRAVIFSLLFFCAATLAGCEDDMADDRGYFESPRQAVDAITVMLEARDWPALTRYYDLEGSGIDRAQLISGAFFWRSERPEVSHPAGFWRYKHPFSPSFEYSWSAPDDGAPGPIPAAPVADPDVPPTPVADPNIIKVVLEVEIDQGAGSPAQRGFSGFRMRKSERGYQILPD